MPIITIDRITKRYGAVTAIDSLTADIRPGRITAFLGPNGSGKTTTMRVLLGLSTPDSGQELIGGERYVDMTTPLRTIGAVLDQGLHPNRSAYSGSRSRRRSWGIRPRSSWTSRSTGWTQTASPRSAISCGTSPTAAAQSSCPVTCSPRSPIAPTT
jgi:energy-coupling factor transporter ATP-binding protein EcfA2